MTAQYAIFIMTLDEEVARLHLAKIGVRAVFDRAPERRHCPSVYLLIPAFDRNQTDGTLIRRRCFLQKRQDHVMKNAVPRTIAQQHEISPEAFVGLWTLGLWALAALYLLVTFSVR